jgi:hypothetical protein
MKRKSPLSPEAEESLQEHIRRACEWLERRKKPEEAEARKGVLAELAQEPREA